MEFPVKVSVQYSAQRRKYPDTVLRRKDDDIFADMENSGEDYAIDVYKLPSKNYKGKEFITCSIC